MIFKRGVVFIAESPVDSIDPKKNSKWLQRLLPRDPIETCCDFKK
jgi:hypothetical protein